MDDTIVNLLQDQMNRERQNESDYDYIASQMENMGYDGFASFFEKQAQEEHGHAKRFATFLISKNIAPKYTSVSGNAGNNDVYGWAQVAYNRERATTGDLEELYRQADIAEEYQVCSLLDWFLTEQIEEENWSLDLVQRLENATKDGVLFLDHEYGEK